MESRKAANIGRMPAGRGMEAERIASGNRGVSKGSGPLGGWSDLNQWLSETCL